MILVTFSLILGVAGCTLPEWQRNVDESRSQNASQNTTDAFEDSLNLIGDDLQAESDVREVAGELTNQITASITSTLVYPTKTYLTHRTVKTFGQYIAPDSGDRFSGYHTGDDVEVDTLDETVAVYAVAAGKIIRRQTVPGYGGVVILEFTFEDVSYHALYGHIDLNSVGMAIGETVTAGQQIGVLGDDQSTATDGERKHLHFGLYPYTGTEQFAGYVDLELELEKWQNPADFLSGRNATLPDTDITKNDISSAIKNVNIKSTE